MNLVQSGSSKGVNTSVKEEASRFIKLSEGQVSDQRLNRRSQSSNFENMASPFLTVSQQIPSFAKDTYEAQREVIHINRKYFCNFFALNDTMLIQEIKLPEGMTAEIFRNLLEFSINTATHNIQKIIAAKIWSECSSIHLKSRGSSVLYTQLELVQQILGLLISYKMPYGNCESRVIELLIRPIIEKYDGHTQPYVSAQPSDLVEMPLFKCLEKLKQLAATRSQPVPRPSETQIVDGVGKDSNRGMLDSELMSQPSPKNHTQASQENTQVNENTWEALLTRLTAIIEHQLTEWMSLQNESVKQVILTLLLHLKETVGQEWLMQLLYRHCLNHKFMLPQKNGSSGTANLQVVKLLMQLKGYTSVFDLLFDEQTQIEQRIRDPDNMPLNILANTRMQLNKLEKTFYKELDPFTKDDSKWSLFVWRTTTSIFSQKFKNKVVVEDDYSLVRRVFEQQQQQFVIEPDSDEEEQENSNQWSQKMIQAHYMMQNDIHQVVNNFHNYDSDINELSIRIRPFADTTTSSAEYFGKNKVIGRSHSQASQLSVGPIKHQILSYLTQIRLYLQTETPPGSGFPSQIQRTFTILPKLCSSSVGGKQYVSLCDIVLPKECNFRTMVIDASVSIAAIHQAILQYICCNFHSVVFDAKIGILKYDQLIMILKNKFINLINEDHLLLALDNWVSYNGAFLQQVMDYERQGFAADGDQSFKQLNELIDNVNWPIVSIEALIQLMLKPNGVLKRLQTVQSRIY